MIKRVVDNYQAIFVFAIITVIMGLVSYQSLPRESSPEIRRPLIFVTTVYPGVSATDIESLVTKEIEDEIDGLTGLDKLTSSSSFGVSSVTAEFTGDTDVETALRRVRERVDVAKADLPADAEEPIVRELNFSDQPILIINIGNPSGLEVLERSADYFEEEIKAIAGVLDVRVSGELQREVQVEIDPAKLTHYGLALNDITGAIQNENVTIPGGVLKNKVREYSLSVSGEIKNPQDFGDIIVSKNGRQVKLEDLGTVSFKYKEPATINRMNGSPAISLAVTKRSGENLLRIIEDIKELLDREKGQFPHGTQVQFSFDESDDVKRMVADLENNIISGLILVLLVTFFFLGPVNATFVSLGIPFSMLISFFVLNALGITLNMVVLFSLVLALGMLVDNGIVIVENIYRHRSMGKKRVRAAIDATNEVAIPITTSTLTTVLAFFPIIFMPDIMGEFMSYIPKTVIIVLTASLLVGLTITTVFCSRFLNVSDKSMQAMTSGTGGFQRIQEVYKRSLNYALDRPIRVIGASFAVVFLGIILNAFFGREPIFFPKFDPRVGIINMTLPSGTPLEQTDQFSDSVEQIIKTVPGDVESIQNTIGRASGGFGQNSQRANKAVIRVGYVPFLEREMPAKESLEGMKAKLAAYPGAEILVTEQQGGPPSGNDISFEVNGQDYAVMGELSEQILAIIGEHKASLELIDSDFEAIKPEVRIEIDREKASIYGFNTRLIASSIRTAINGSKVSTYREGKEEYDVTVKFRENARNRLAALQELEIVSDGKRVALGSFASIVPQSTVEVIKRKNRLRTISVYADFLPGIQNKAAIKEDIETKVAQLSIPEGYRIGGGEGQAVRQEAQTFLLQAFMVAVLLIFLVMVTQFNSVTQPAIIMAAVFLSVGGVFWGLLLSQKVFVIIMSGIGIISLAGVVVNNAIVLIDYINQLVREGMPVRDAVIEGGSVRLRPVILTAITTVIGLMPMALGWSIDFHNMTVQFTSESSEWWSPMAWAVIFGLSFATVFTLIIVPTFVYADYRMWARFGINPQARPDDDAEADDGESGSGGHNGSGGGNGSPKLMPGASEQDDDFVPHVGEAAIESDPDLQDRV